MKCLYCGAEVSQQEMWDRYNALIKQGIVPMLLVTCGKCRGAIETPKVEMKS